MSKKKKKSKRGEKRIHGTNIKMQIQLIYILIKINVQIIIVRSERIALQTLQVLIK